tara:strand:+ start:886 stop:1335 length:450 start_codon:yes stop_codon:yes gene_type:complete
MTEFLANQRQSYNKWTRDVIRYADLDPVGHVNNNAYGLFIENARTDLFMEVEKEIKSDLDSSSKCDWVLRKLDIDFLREIHYPGEVDVGIAITRIGTSSMVVNHGVFTNDYCAATAIGISVYFDLETRSSTPIPEKIQQAMLKIASPKS